MFLPLQVVELSIEGDSILSVLSTECPPQHHPWLGFYEDTYRVMVYTVITVVITTLIILGCGYTR